MCESHQRVLIARPPHDAVASATTASTRASRTPDRCQARLATTARPTSRQPRPALGEYMPLLAGRSLAAGVTRADIRARLHEWGTLCRTTALAVMHS